MKTTMLMTTVLLAAAGLAHSAEPFSLTKDNLGEVLTNMGLRPDRGGIKFTISASISNDATEVWLNTYVAEIADIAKLPVGVVDKPMIASNDFGPSHFTFVAGEKPGARSVYLHRALDNRRLSPAMIHDAIDNLASDVVGAKPLWEAAGR